MGVSIKLLLGDGVEDSGTKSTDFKAALPD